MGQGDAIAPGARREAAGDGDRAFNTHIRHIRILSGCCDLAKNKERPISFNLDGNGRLGRLVVPVYLFSKKLLARPNFYLSAYLERNRDEYYDRLLASINPRSERPVRIVAEFDCQVVDAVPAGPADQPFHILLSESQLIRLTP